MENTYPIKQMVIRVSIENSINIIYDLVTKGLTFSAEEINGVMVIELKGGF